MNLEEFSRAQAGLIDEFNRHEERGDGAQVAASLSAGFDVLRSTLLVRFHDDVQMFIGRDSMLMPVSDEKMRKTTGAQIEIYQVAEAALAAKGHRYVRPQDGWFGLWLTRLRLPQAVADPQVAGQLAEYLREAPDRRRRRFMDVVAQTAWESRRAPLVLFRLIQPAIEIAVSVAFGDRATADGRRKKQTEALSAIGDCPTCHGHVLENGQQCPGCGNPLWTFKCLTTTD